LRAALPAAVARDGARAPDQRSLAEHPLSLSSFPRADVVLNPALPEIALIGRSNVGKSSLLNALAGRRIAKVSGTPGKTRMLNVYVLSVGSGERGAVPSAANPAPVPHRKEPLPAPPS